MSVIYAQGRFHRDGSVQLAEPTPARAESPASTPASKTHAPLPQISPVRDTAEGPNEPAPTTPGGPHRLWREVVGEQIRHLRTENAERLADVAERAGVSPQYLSEIERGIKDPSSEVLEAVAGALGTSVEGLARRAYRLIPAPQPHPAREIRSSPPVHLAA